MNSYVVILSLIVAFYGLFIGSFLNVCIYRIPLNQTVITVPSHCTTCNHKLAWYDLFPLFSYLFLGGKCRYCKAHISVQYPLVEALNSVMWFFTFYLTIKSYSYIFCLQSVLMGILNCLFVSALIVLSGIDIFHQEVPVKVNIFILILGIISLIIDHEFWASHVIGLFAVSLPMLVLVLLGGMGGGDMKLYAAAGFFIGWRAALLSLVIACLVGAVVSMPYFVKQRKKGVKHPHVPFVPFIAIGMYIAMFFGSEIIEWYIHTFIMV